MNVFESSAAELDKLHERVHELARRRSESPEVKAAWREAAQTFHANYDRLAFPGGLTREFERLRNGDTEAIELAIRYLEANPWYFRSGYHKAEILKFLKRYPLTQEQCARLRQVILDRVRGKPTREMRAYARLAPRVTNDQFEAEILAIKEKSNRYSARSAATDSDIFRVHPYDSLVRRTDGLRLHGSLHRAARKVAFQSSWLARGTRELDYRRIPSRPGTRPVVEIRRT